MMEQDEVRGVEDGHEMMVIKLNLEKKKEKNKNRKDQGKGPVWLAESWLKLTEKTSRTSWFLGKPNGAKGIR